MPASPRQTIRLDDGAGCRHCLNTTQSPQPIWLGTFQEPMSTFKKVSAILGALTISLGMVPLAAPAVAQSTPTIRVRGEITPFISMQGGRSYFKVVTPDGKTYWGHLSDRELQDPRFQLAFASCDFRLFDTGEKLTDLTNNETLFGVAAQENCTSTLK